MTNEQDLPHDVRKQVEQERIEKINRLAHGIKEIVDLYFDPSIHNEADGIALFEFATDLRELSDEQLAASKENQN